MVNNVSEFMVDNGNVEEGRFFMCIIMPVFTKRNFECSFWSGLYMKQCVPNVIKLFVYFDVFDDSFGLNSKLLVCYDFFYSSE